MSDHLSLPIRLSDEDYDRFDRLATLTRRVANHVPEEHRPPAHLDGIADSVYRAWNYTVGHKPSNPGVDSETRWNPE